MDVKFLSVSQTQTALIVVDQLIPDTTLSLFRTELVPVRY
ncbi:hypothetical protein SAMN03159512_01655 [Pseudomonas sp. NFR09]|nr:hypothetical protein SAMN03159512_01655 [Pseudomonas sp. NFR09]